MQKDYGQSGFAGAMIKTKGLREEKLKKLASVVDWKALEELAGPLRGSKKGRPAYPVSVMIRSLMLQRWHGLSDVALEEALDDQLSFRAFAGIPVDETAPDHATIWRFREALSQHGLDKALFEEVNRQLESKGLILRQGTLVDATIRQAAVNPPPFKEGEVADKDPDAGFTKKNDTTFFGFKGHIGVDAGSTLVRCERTTSADVHDSQVFADVIVGDEEFVAADKAYGSAANRAMLTEAGIKDRVMHKASRGHPLKPWQTWMNKVISPIRSEVERVFAHLKQMDGPRCRSFGLRRNSTAFTLLCTAYNIRRAASLSATTA